VVPQIGGGNLGLQLLDLLAHGVEIEHVLNAAKRAGELVDLFSRIDVCHASLGYATLRGPNNMARCVYTVGGWRRRSSPSSWRERPAAPALPPHPRPPPSRAPAPRPP